MIAGDYMETPLGYGSEFNFEKVRQGGKAIVPHALPGRFPHPVLAALLTNSSEDHPTFTRLENLFIRVIGNLIATHSIPTDQRTLVLISSTKGNIALLNNPAFEGKFQTDRAYLPALCNEIRTHFGFHNPVIALSNACISGALGLSIARNLLLANQYEHALVIGGDEVSWFVQAGFESFQAVSEHPCKPFDLNRNGISLGEAGVGIYLKKSDQPNGVFLTGAGSANDANHISGPSRTGEGLFRSIKTALKEAQLETVDYVSAHGTATRYNDDMESIAMQRAGLSQVPVNSFKGIFGHTLGASGLLESVLGIHCLLNDTLLPSVGFEKQGTTEPLNVIEKTETRPLHSFIKLASGFGGCNQALVFEKTKG